MMVDALPADWQDVLKDEIRKPYFVQLISKLESAYRGQTIYPSPDGLFNAFRLCPFNQVKVVIIGQDPYHGAGQAHGLCFSVNDGQRIPPSLQNIFKELKEDIPGFVAPASGNLGAWARQGVLLLNTILSVQAGVPGSHKNLGWERFTDTIIRTISDHKEHVVFLLWGNYAAGKAALIDEGRHLVLRAAHPSPLARGAFFGCRHFSLTNKYLINKGLEPVNWHLS